MFRGYTNYYLEDDCSFLALSALNMWAHACLAVKQRPFFLGCHYIEDQQTAELFIKKSNRMK